MKAGVFVALLGLAAGAAANRGYLALHLRPSPNSLEGQLAWMRNELHLSDAQFRAIRELHLASGPRLRQLAGQVEQMRAELTAFENTRRASDQVDFVKFADFVAQRRAIRRECIASAQALVAATGGTMDARQRQRYLALTAQIRSEVE